MAYINEYNGDSLVATASVFLGLTLISVLLRIYVRVFMTNSFQMDDWFMVFAQVSLFFFTMLDEGLLRLARLILPPGTRRLTETTRCRLSLSYHAPSSCLV